MADRMTDGLGCYRCGRAPCACGEGLQAWDRQRERERQAFVGGIPAPGPGVVVKLDTDGLWRPVVVPAPGPRPVSAEDAMKRANEAAALAEKAVATAEAAKGSWSRTVARAIDADRDVVDSRIAEAVATEARNRADACSRLVDGLSEGVLGGMAGVRLRQHENETSNTFADIGARLMKADERIGRLIVAVDVQMKERAKADDRIAALERALGELGLRAGNTMAGLEEKLDATNARIDLHAQGALGFEDEARGARTAAAGWRRATWVAIAACAAFAGAFACLGWRCATLAREADEAKALLFRRDRSR